MPIDTVVKKLSVLNYMRVDNIILPRPTGTISTHDKYTLLNMYGFGLGEEDAPFSTILLTGLSFSTSIVFCQNINTNTGTSICLAINRIDALILKIEQEALFILVR